MPRGELQDPGFDESLPEEDRLPADQEITHPEGVSEAEAYARVLAAAGREVIVGHKRHPSLPGRIGECVLDGLAAMKAAAFDYVTTRGMKK